jgi:hypothetical protein
MEGKVALLQKKSNLLTTSLESKSYGGVESVPASAQRKQDKKKTPVQRVNEIISY